MKKKIALLVVLLGLGLAVPVVDDHLQAVSVMLHVVDPATQHFAGRYRQLSVREEVLAMPDGSRARLYIPERRRARRSMVVVHGVHRLGIAEPRLVAFARSLAAQGIEVLTPELPGIADFRVTPDSITAIGNAAKEMRRRCGEPVGMFGLSFSGGLALMAAADERFRDDVAFVVATGAHHDLARVARFFALNEAPRPNGEMMRLQAHEYGALVLAYAHPEDFFPAAEAEAARACLRAVLYETRCDTATLPSKTREEMKFVFAHDTAHFRERILENARKRAGEYAVVSPQGKLSGLKARVLLLHGAMDDVIPPSESEWLAQEVPSGRLQELLISPAVSHVEVAVGKRPLEQLRVINFVAEMIDEAED